MQPLVAAAKEGVSEAKLTLLLTQLSESVQVCQSA